jgi:hypothetical protein
MQRSRVLILLVLLLAVLNGVLIYLHFFTNRSGGRDRGDSMHSWLDKNLGLTEEQERLHLKMRGTYFSELKSINDTLKLLKARFVSQSAQLDLTDSLATVWTDSISSWNRKADVLTYRHVRNVRSILDPKQQPVWDSLIQVLMLRRDRK